MPFPTTRTHLFSRLLFTFVLPATLLLSAGGCSKSGSPATTPPKNATTVAVTISFPDGHTYQCSDYSVPDSTGVWPNLIDGRVDTLQPVIWLSDNNVDHGWDFNTYGVTGMTPGKSYSLIFSTPKQYDNTAVAEAWDPNVYNPTLGWTLAQGSVFIFQGSTYDVRQLVVTTSVADSSKTNPTSGGFSVSLVADSVFTATTRSAYTEGQIQITGTFTNMSINP